MKIHPGLRARGKTARLGDGSAGFPAAGKIIRITEELFWIT